MTWDNEQGLIDYVNKEAMQQNFEILFCTKFDPVYKVYFEKLAVPIIWKIKK